METRKNLCAMLPLALHTRVRQEQEKARMTLGEYVEAIDHRILRLEGWKNHDRRNENLSRADPRRTL